MKFYIDQLSLAPNNPAAAKALLSEMDAQTTQWHHDLVRAHGHVHGFDATQLAEHSFHYGFSHDKRDPGHWPLEVEVVQRVEGSDWLGANTPTVASIGMRCSDEELTAWRLFFERRRIPVAQEFVTATHTNPALAKKGRRYRHVVFNTRAILGVDVKFTVRLNSEGAPHE